MYATSVVSAAAARAAEQVAQSPQPAQAVAPAEEAARGQMGGFGASRAQFVWEEVDDQQVVLQVRAPSPEFLPLIPGWGAITKTVTVRTERFR